MNRRTLIRRIGATGLATTALAGTTSAEPDVQYGIDREIDVADVSGTVTLDRLIEPEERANLPERIDPRTHEITVADEAGTITLDDDCCVYCCQVPVVCDCLCCTCEWDCNA